MGSREENRIFGRNASILLDILRFAAALAVALTHLPLFMAGGKSLISQHSGNTAVCVFFVLSGFVMRFVTVTRVTTARAYIIDRLSRMYSVVVPALLLTVVLEWAARRGAPLIYAHAATPFAWSDVPAQIVENLTFTFGWWNFGAAPLSNGAFWSLSFECVYYALFGLLLYAPRARWVLMPLLLLLVGPSIALLFPIWLLGAALYDVHARLTTKRFGFLSALCTAVVYVLAVLAFRHQILTWLRATDVTQRKLALTHFMANLSWGRSLFHGAELHWLDRFSTSYLLTGTLLAVLLLPALLALDRLPAASKAWANRIRLVADSTFALYLLHLPFFLFLTTVTHGPWVSWRKGLSMLTLVIALCIVFARFFDRLKNVMRSWLRGIWA